MIRAISSMVSGGVDLLEAEGRLARVHLLRIVALSAILILTGFVGAIALTGAAAGAVILLAQEIGTGPALLWIGLGLLLACIITAFVAWSGLGPKD